MAHRAVPLRRHERARQQQQPRGRPGRARGRQLPRSGRTAGGRGRVPVRDEVNRTWLHESFEVATRDGAPAVVIAIHADPGFETPPAQRAAQQVDGYDRFLAALVVETRAFAKPVVLIHGDSHRYVHDRPLIDPATGQPVPNFIRVETFGSPDVGWVEVTLDPKRANDPQVAPRLVRER